MSLSSAGKDEEMPGKSANLLRTGFFLVQGHGLPRNVLDEVFEARLLVSVSSEGKILCKIVQSFCNEQEGCDLRKWQKIFFSFRWTRN